MPNLQLPGNPRYQPQSLVEIFGYDNLIKPAIEVELATLETLSELGTIPLNDFALLTPEVRSRIMSITTSEVDAIERRVTKHDVRALVHLIQERMPDPLRRFVHVPLTSYDVLDTARSIQFTRAYLTVLAPKIEEVLLGFADQIERYAETVQIGRTHGQHALPITIGFWFATTAMRIVYNYDRLRMNAGQLVGKISGAVGAHNAQIGLGLCTNGFGFETLVLSKLDIPPAHISTQILPPEPLADFLFSALLMSATFGQFGRDCRHLMRTEIAELTEPYEAGQVGSSTMAHKRNPINFENLEGMWLKNKSEFGKVLDTLVSEHQRDLVGSSVSRDYPILLVNLVQQLGTLLGMGNSDAPFIKRIAVDVERCALNLRTEGSAVLAEPLYLALQLAGFRRDAHKLVNEVIIPEKKANHAASLTQIVERHLSGDMDLSEAWEKVPDETKWLLNRPEEYIGVSIEKARSVCGIIRTKIRSAKS